MKTASYNDIYGIFPDQFQVTNNTSVSHSIDRDHNHVTTLIVILFTFVEMCDDLSDIRNKMLCK